MHDPVREAPSWVTMEQAGELWRDPVGAPGMPTFGLPMPTYGLPKNKKGPPKLSP